MVFRGRFVLPCPGPSRGSRTMVVVAAQGAPCKLQHSGRGKLTTVTVTKSRFRSHGQHNEAGPCPGLSLSQTVDYNIMQQQSKHFSFRKSFRKVFNVSERGIQSTCELWEASIFLCR